MNYSILSILSVLIFVSCNDEQKEIKPKVEWTTEQSIGMNQVFSSEERADIESYLSRRPDWKMTKTGSGLQYFIYEKSEPDIYPKVGQVVFINFTISLLDGRICYSSKRGNPDSFMVEKSDIESGIHEGVKLMKIGEKAKLILPSHLAHGLIGDMDEIPPLQPIIYDIELVSIK